MYKEKIKKGNKGTWALLLSIVAIVLCIAVFLLWIFETIPHSVVTPDSFIGASVTLLSIVVTVGIGWQIFNVVEVKNTMKELKGKQERVDELHNELKAEIQKVKDDAEDMMNIMYYLHAQMLSLQALSMHRFDIAFNNHLLALSYFMQLEEPDPLIANEILKDMESSINKIDQFTIDKEKLKKADECIRKQRCFNWIENRYNNVMTKFFSVCVAFEKLDAASKNHQ